MPLWIKVLIALAIWQLMHIAVTLSWPSEIGLDLLLLLFVIWQSDVGRGYDEREMRS